MTTTNKTTGGTIRRDTLPGVGDPGLSLRAQAHTATERAEPRCFDAELRLLPGVTIPLRSMLVELPNSRVLDPSHLPDRVLISPVATGEEHAAVGDDLTTLVAPSLLHHRHLDAAIRRYQPGALWG